MTQDHQPIQYGISSTIIPHQPGSQIKDEMGHVYVVTEPSTWNEHLRLYDTSTQLLHPRTFDEQTTNAIEELGLDIALMNEQEVQIYAKLKMQDPDFQVKDFERQLFTRQQAPEQSALFELPEGDIELPEGDIDTLVREAVQDIDLDQLFQIDPPAPQIEPPEPDFGR